MFTAEELAKIEGRWGRPTLVLAGVVVLALIVGFFIGRSTSPHQRVDMIWSPIPDAVTIGNSVDDPKRIAVYYGEALVRTYGPKDKDYVYWAGIEPKVVGDVPNAHTATDKGIMVVSF